MKATICSMKATTARVLVLVLVVFCLPASAQPRADMDRLLDAPLSSELTAAKDGRQVAWVSYERGCRNVRLARAPDWRMRQVTAFDQDDGMEIEALGWSSDGTSLYFARGGRTGIAAASNPEPLPLPPERSIWRVRLGSAGDAAPERIAAGHAPAVSPTGADMAYLHEDGLYLWSAAGARSELLVKGQGDIEELRWSPDGRAIAFTSSRDSHAFVGVYWLAERRLVYLDPGVDKDRAPVWSPDGRRVAFLRWAHHEMLDKPAREGVPFSLRVSDARTGEGHEVWRAPAGRGAGLSPKIFWGSQLFEGDALLWAEGGRLVFPWEGDGWLHLYSVPVAGGDAVLLTPGDYEVAQFQLSLDRRHVVFASNRDDPERQHLWRVPVGGGAAVALTNGQGIESSPRPLYPEAGTAFLASSARAPVHAALVDPQGRVRRLDPTLADFPADTLVDPQAVTLTAADGLRFSGQLLLPPASVPAPSTGRPALLFLHGGPPDRMLLGYHYWRYYSLIHALHQSLARSGYVVLSINFRRGSGYGLDFREADSGGLNGASELQDVVAAGRWLRAREGVDPARVGLWGGSYGGYLTAMGLARAPDLFAAGVDMHGVHDWFTREYEDPPLTRDPAGQADAAVALAFASSPLADVSRWRAPVLFIHGDDDLNVKFDQTVRLVDALRKRGLTPETLIFPGEPHQFLLHRSWRRALHATADFLDRHLANVASVALPAPADR